MNLIIYCFTYAFLKNEKKKKNMSTRLTLIGAKTTLARRQNHFARRQARFGKFSNDFGRRPNGL